MDNVLILAMEYAPYQTTGAFRTIYFTKYLREFGYNPVVVSIKPDDSNKQFIKIYNPDLNKLVIDNATIYRAALETPKESQNKIFKKLSMFFKINDRLGSWWAKGLEEKLPSIIATHQPKLIYVSCPPFSTAALAVKYAKQFNLPLVIDMRDGWSHWCISPFASYLHYYFTWRSERNAFKTASKIITVTKQLKEIFIHSQRSIAIEKFLVIPNGFDQKLKYDATINFVGLKNNNRKIIISYIGAFYYIPQAHKEMFTKWYKKKNHKIFQFTPHLEDWTYRSPYYFLKTIAEMISNYPEMEEVVEFHHFGKKLSWVDEMVADLKLENIFKARGYLKHEELGDEIKKSDLFLCTSVKVIDGEDYAIASKTFEYIAAQKPILGFVTKGSQAEFLEKSNSGLLFDPDNITESASKLYDLLQLGIELKLNENFLKQFERRNTTKELANQFKNLIDS